MDDLDETIATLVKNGPDLRRAGYQSVTIGAVSFTLHPPEPVETDDKRDDEGPTDPLNDPTTYGLAPGEKPPGFTDPRRKATT